MKFILLTITTATVQDAKHIAGELLKQNLIACANIIPKISSIYVWEGQLEDVTEAMMIVKTTEKLCKKVIDHIKSIHPYDCPAIVAIPIIDGNPDYLHWTAMSIATPKRIRK